MPFNADVNRFDVAVEVGLLVERLVVTQSTNVAFYRFVSFAVIPKFLGRSECSLADIAREVSLFGMGFPVGMKIARSSEQLTADFTLILSFIIVNSQVKLKISRLCEPSMARLALKWLLPGMDPLVSLQISAIIKFLPTD